MDDQFFKKFNSSKTLKNDFMGLKFTHAGINTGMVGKDNIVSFSSNDYLSLAKDSRVIEAAKNALLKFGTGSGSSLAGSGSLIIHQDLCENLADFLGKEAVMLLPTGYQAMFGFVSFNIINGARLFSDMFNHRCILDGISLGQGNLSDNEVSTHYFLHNNHEYFENLLKSYNCDLKYPLLMIEGIYSGEGDCGKLDKFIPICKKNNVLSAIDDAHGLGVLGDNGRGTANEFGLTDDIDFILGTFSKSLAGHGGFISGKKDHIEYMKSNMGTYIFSASSTPSNVATSIAALNIIRSEGNEIKKRLWNNINHIKKRLKEEDFKILTTDSAIIPVAVGGHEETLYYARKLLEANFFVVPFVFPAVKKGSEKLRVSINANHSFQQIDALVEELSNIRKTIKKNHV